MFNLRNSIIALNAALAAYAQDAIHHETRAITDCSRAQSILIATCSGQSEQLAAIQEFCPKFNGKFDLFGTLLGDVEKKAEGCRGGEPKVVFEERLTGLEGFLNPSEQIGASVYGTFCTNSSLVQRNVDLCKDAIAAYEAKMCPDVVGFKRSLDSQLAKRSDNPSKDILEILPSFDACEKISTQRSCSYTVAEYEEAGFTLEQATEIEDICIPTVRFENGFRALCALENFITIGIENRCGNSSSSSSSMSRTTSGNSTHSRTTTHFRSTTHSLPPTNPSHPTKTREHTTFTHSSEPTYTFIPSNDAVTNGRSLFVVARDALFAAGFLLLGGL